MVLSPGDLKPPVHRGAVQLEITTEVGVSDHEARMNVPVPGEDIHQPSSRRAVGILISAGSVAHRVA